MINDLMLGTWTKAHLPAILFASCFTPVDNFPNAYESLLNHCIHLYKSDHAYQRTTEKPFPGVLAPTAFEISHLASVAATYWEVLVVVLVTFSAFSHTKFAIFPFHSNVADFVVSYWWLWQDYTSHVTMSCVTHTGTWGEGHLSTVGTWPLGGSVFPQPALWLVVLSLLLLLPVSHCHVPQQGLLGELILIQQQIQRHEEEVRRAAAANNARPPPPEPAPVPPQQKRKVKVTTHLDKPVIRQA